MAHDTHDAPDWDISSEDEFDSAIQTLFLAAIETGIDPRGAWVFRNRHANLDFEIIVTELAE